jgi:hypothetical protein
MILMWILELGHKRALISRAVAGVEHCKTGMRFGGIYAGKFVTEKLPSFSKQHCKMEEVI